MFNYYPLLVSSTKEKYKSSREGIINHENLGVEMLYVSVLPKKEKINRWKWEKKRCGLVVTEMSENYEVLDLFKIWWTEYPIHVSVKDNKYPVKLIKIRTS